MRWSASARGSDKAKRGHMSAITRGTVLAILLVLPTDLVGQADDQVPRLPWGASDLQGVWLYWTATPLERPLELGEKAVVTPEEAAAFVAQQHELVQGEISGDWNPLVGFLNGRTSLLIDPPGGRLPARTEAGQHRADTLGLLPEFRSADRPEDRDRWERCIMGHSVPFSPTPWDQRIQILQTQDHVAIQDEEGELRLIPVTEPARLPESIGQWAGSSRGHWEGDTLVVETTNFNGKWSFHGAGPRMQLVERFTRTAGGTLDYEFTVHDPESFASVWTGRFPFTHDPGPIYEMACHEGNRSMPLILNGARTLERADQDRSR